MTVYEALCSDPEILLLGTCRNDESCGHGPDADCEISFYMPALVGIGGRINLGPVAVYSEPKVIEILARDYCSQGVPSDEAWSDAQEMYSFNIAGCYIGERTPLFISEVEDFNV